MKPKNILTGGQILGITEDATVEEVKNRLRKALSMIHPDKASNRGEQTRILTSLLDTLHRSGVQATAGVVLETSLSIEDFAELPWEKGVPMAAVIRLDRNTGAKTADASSIPGAALMVFQVNNTGEFIAVIRTSIPRYHGPNLVVRAERGGQMSVECHEVMSDIGAAVKENSGIFLTYWIGKCDPGELRIECDSEPTTLNIIKEGALSRGECTLAEPGRMGHRLSGEGKGGNHRSSPHILPFRC